MSALRRFYLEFHEIDYNILVRDPIEGELRADENDNCQRIVAGFFLLNVKNSEF